MVRLKVRSRSVKQNFKEISIPYGSIKRIPNYSVFCGFISISIPYGSIKSQTLYDFRPVFQISIPYGSIKSANKNRIAHVGFIFQFLMVRLKDNMNETKIKAKKYFNSLWFD